MFLQTLLLLIIHDYEINVQNHWANDPSLNHLLINEHAPDILI